MKKKLLALGLCLTFVLGLCMTPALAEGEESWAQPSDQSVRVDDAIETLHMYALLDANGYATNYVRIRDVAYLLNGTPAQFNIDFYSGIVHVVTGQGYASNGTELAAPFSGAMPYGWSGDRTDINGQMLPLSSIRITAESGGGYTYYKLRDLGQYLGFGVDWDLEQGISISTAG